MDPRIEAALRAVPRGRFLPDEVRQDADVDAPLPIGQGQTSSAPHMVRIMTEALRPAPGQRVLEVGGGSGWHATVLARLVAPGGRVVSIERHADLAARARAAAQRLDPRLAVEFFVADGSGGFPARAPFDRISVAAGAPTVPRPLIEQLAPGGILVIPVGPQDMQELERVTKRADGGADVEHLGACRFVPLVGRYGFPEGAG